MQSILRPPVGHTEAQRFSVFLSEFAHADPAHAPLLQELCGHAWRKCGFRSSDPLDLMTFRHPDRDFNELRCRVLKLMGLHARAFGVRVPSARIAAIAGPPHASTLLLTNRGSGPFFLQVACSPAGAVSGITGDSLTGDERRVAMEAAQE